MSLNHHLPKKISLVPKKHHGFQFLIFILGFFLPPLAVATRFGIGKDFFINCFLCICGYFPSHGHNFYIQNIRNNENKERTPKWVRKAGLVDPAEAERRAKKNQWKGRFDERNTQSTLVGAALEEGESGENYVPESDEAILARERRRNEGLWGRSDEEYYNEAPNQRHWHYPANFEGTDAERDAEERYGGRNRRDSSPSRRQSVDSITGAAAYPTNGATDNDVPEWGKDYGSKSKKSGKKVGFGIGKKNKKNHSTVGGWIDEGRGSGGGGGGGGGYADDMDRDDGWGGSGAGRHGYGDDGRDMARRTNGNANTGAAAGGGSNPGRNGDPNWEHEF